MISVIDIAKEFSLQIQGEANKLIIAPGSLTKKNEQYIYWLKSPKYAFQITVGTLLINESHFSAIELNPNICYLITKENPRLIFAKILAKYFSHLGLKLSPNQVNKHKLNPELTICDNVYIGEEVTIGGGTIIYPNVVIHNNTTIGQNCVIKSNCTVATEGLGYEKENGNWFKFPQLGGVRIGNNVEMGPSATIRRGALDNTVIEDGSKIGSFTNIGHNCIIGKNAILTCQCVTGGSTKLEENVYMGIQSSTRNGVFVGKNAVIGAGAMVIKDVKSNETVIGNPAQPILDYREWSALRKELIKQNRIDEK